jgi:hypothetical protein
MNLVGGKHFGRDQFGHIYIGCLAKPEVPLKQRLVSWGGAENRFCGWSDA